MGISRRRGKNSGEAIPEQGPASAEKGYGFLQCKCGVGLLGAVVHEKRPRASGQSRHRRVFAAPPLRRNPTIFPPLVVHSMNCLALGKGPRSSSLDRLKVLTYRKYPESNWYVSELAREGQMKLRRELKTTGLWERDLEIASRSLASKARPLTAIQSD
jgi:hypothetical protein